MRATFMYGAGDVRVTDVPDPIIKHPTDAIVRIVRAYICGSDLHPYHSMPVTPGGKSLGHECIGVVEDIGSDVTTVRRGDLVITPFAWSDGTCEFCREGLQTSCRDGGFWNAGDVGGMQAEALRVPLADGTLVAVPVEETSPLIPSLLTLSDVYGTGYHAAAKAGVSPRTTVTVIGDGAVGLMAILSAKQLGAERIAGGVISRVGVPQYEDAPVGFGSLFGPNITLTGGPAPARAYIDTLLPDVLSGAVDPGRVFDAEVQLADIARGYHDMDTRRALKVLVKP